MKKILAWLLAFVAFAAQATAGAPPIPPPAPNTFQNAQRFAAAIKAFAAGTASGVPARICAIGDSTTFGVGSQGTATTALNTYSWPDQLVQALGNFGVPAHEDSFMGDKGASQTLTSDSRLTIGSSWTQQTGSESLGGAQLIASTSTNNLAFLPVNNVDTFRIFYVAGAGYGTFAWQVDSAGWNNQVESGATGLQSITVSAGISAGHTLSVKQVSGTVNIQGMEGYDSTNPQVSIINMGWSSSTTPNWAVTTNAQSPGNSAPYATVGCTTTIFNLGINDEKTGSGVTSTTTNTNIALLIAAAKAAGSDVLVMAPNPIQTGQATVPVQIQYMNAVKQAAAAGGATLINLYDKWGSYALTSGSGLQYDSLHPSRQGYGDIAQFIASALVPPGTPNNVYGLVSAQQPAVNDYGYIGLRSATSSGAGSADAGLTRGGSGVIQCGSGARGSAGCTLQLAGLQIGTGGSSCKTSAYTLTSTDNAICVTAASAAIAITLPACTSPYGQDFYVKKTDATAYAINIGNGTDTVDGVSGTSAASLTTQNASVHLRCMASTVWWKF